MKSIHVRRLESRVAQTSRRFVELARRDQLSVADLPDVRLPWYTIRNADGAGDEPEQGVATVLVYDEIGGSFGMSAEQFAEDLQQITAPTIHLRINSPGGSLFDGRAIYNSLNHHPARIVTFVDSLAASAASLIALAGDEIVFMPGAEMMIHDASAVEDGDSEAMTKMAAFLNRESDGVAELYRLRAGGTIGYWRELMRAETWMFGHEAIEFGLGDRIAEVAPARVAAPDDGEAGEADEQMTRAHDLSRFRYPGRRAAPAPGQRTATRAPVAHTRARDEQPQRAAPAPVGDMREAGANRARAYRALGVTARTSLRSEAGVPLGMTRSTPFDAQMSAELVRRGDRDFYRVEGYATVFERPYEMWDEFGPYKEVVGLGAADRTLAANPDVIFLTNHRGLSMARTTAKTLELGADSTGMSDVAWMNPERPDVKTLYIAIQDKDVTEQSFGFMIVEGLWNQDFTEFRIAEFDIDRGDVSAVNYGANPYTSIAARQRDIFAELDRMPAYAARAAMTRLAQRAGAVPDRPAQPAAPVQPAPVEEPKGRSIAYIEALLLTDSR